MKIYKWVPVANQENRQSSALRKTLFCRKDKSRLAKEEENEATGNGNSIQANEDSNMSQESSNPDSQDAPASMMTSSSNAGFLVAPENAQSMQSVETATSEVENCQKSLVSKDLSTSWAMDESSMMDSSLFQQDESTRQSQDSNYSEEEVNGGSRSNLIDISANDESNLSFPNISDNTQQTTNDGNEADPDMRLAMSMVGGQAVVGEDSKQMDSQYSEPPVLEPQMKPAVEDEMCASQQHPSITNK